MRAVPFRYGTSHLSECVLITFGTPTLLYNLLPPSMITGPIFAFLLLHTQLHEGGPAGWRPVEGGFCSEFVGEKPRDTPV